MSNDIQMVCVHGAKHILLRGTCCRIARCVFVNKNDLGKERSGRSSVASSRHEVLRAPVLLRTCFITQSDLDV